MGNFIPYEANVEEIKPEELRELVKKKIEQMRQVYKNGLDVNRRWQDDWEKNDRDD